MNTTCDLKKGACNKVSVPLLNTYSSSTISVSLIPKNIVCPDGKTTCSSQSTCCELKTGSFGCCPHPEANCCSDKMYCCPHGYFCDPNSDKCKHSDFPFPALPKTPTSSHIALKKLCGDDKVCGSNDTCCKYPDDTWACCPTLNGVCCSNGLYCCPANTTCNLIDNSCDYSGHALPMIDITVQNLVHVQIQLRAEANSGCDDDETSCLMEAGVSGCCPSKEAVCCSDMLHCCPAGSTCGNNGDCVNN